MTLNDQLEAARKAYYAGSPIMSDAEYDVLEQQLAGMEPTAPVLHTVGTDEPGRIPHSRPMLSIENIYSVEELIAWAHQVTEKLGLKEWPTFALEYKWDGVSASLIYMGGKLVQATTRGNGMEGESILPQVLASPHVPCIVTELGRFEVRGELCIQQSTLDRLNEELAKAGKPLYMSARNLVAGTMKLQDFSEVGKREVCFIPWEVYLRGSASSDLAELQYKMSAHHRDSHVVHNVEELRATLESMIQDLGKPSNIARDGIVLKLDDWNLRDKMGVGSKFAKYQVCFKMQNAKTETVLKDVVWQVGRFGRLTPVGIVEPVTLAGARIERVTLNNLSWIESMGVKIGSRVVIMRSGDVIPKIVSVED